MRNRVLVNCALLFIPGTNKPPVRYTTAINHPTGPRSPISAPSHSVNRLPSGQAAVGSKTQTVAFNRLRRGERAAADGLSRGPFGASGCKAAIRLKYLFELDLWKTIHAFGSNADVLDRAAIGVLTVS